MFLPIVTDSESIRSIQENVLCGCYLVPSSLCPGEQEQSSSPELLTLCMTELCGGIFLSWTGPVPCRIFPSMPGLCPVDADGMPLLVVANNVSTHCQMFPKGQIASAANP